ncbi:hypothetical protein SAMN05444166_5945 [Singulisphaera sp. GP187]|uniref:hypothetical protein n=1 Tax=Singulisphaera sp. GP187 TaxID=1882752 RepID=UPI00092AAF88|nr:hypothetical protein [Singulisphaera sp. GP187]SIO59156.1 hypothetical protein SAMN05444166_5945 [Singulisphaera sp. GP187]
MHRISALVIACLFTLIGGSGARPILAALAEADADADAPDVAGAWKLVIMQFGEDEFAIFDVKATDGNLAGAVTSAQSMLGPIKKAEGTVKGDQITIRFPEAGEPLVFDGVLDKARTKGLGNIQFRGRGYPGRIEKTEAKKVANLANSPIRQKVAQVQEVKDPKERTAKVLELIKENAGHPANAAAYELLLSGADAAGLGPDEVRAQVEKWSDEAKPYGAEWTGEVQSRALKALQGKKDYAALATELGQAAVKALPADASLELRGNLVALLARSARLAGKEEIAAEAESRIKEIDTKLDAEYHEKVPPFKPETYAGRPDGKGTRVVLMEIFTGAECPPCVAADVAFDALLKTYKPSEFIGLQHHLHIPGPDPLTSPDTIARQTYYGTEVRGTPSTFFNGKSQSGGGGSMAGAEGKYKDYRKVIEPALDAEKRCEIKLTATRAGDEIKIDAQATCTPAAPKADGADDKDKDAAKEPKPKLRLVLVEESVRYPGATGYGSITTSSAPSRAGSRASPSNREKRRLRRPSISPSSARARRLTSKRIPAAPAVAPSRTRCRPSISTTWPWWPWCKTTPTIISGTPCKSRSKPRRPERSDEGRLSNAWASADGRPFGAAITNSDFILSCTQGLASLGRNGHLFKATKVDSSS